MQLSFTLPLGSTMKAVLDHLLVHWMTSNGAPALCLSPPPCFLFVTYGLYVSLFQFTAVSLNTSPLVSSYIH
jgi:hypothetical protein